MPRGKKEQAPADYPKLREVEVRVRRGKTVVDSVKKIGVTIIGRSSAVRHLRKCR